MTEPTHYGNDQMGASALHRGPLENCPAPECQDAIAEQDEEPWLPAGTRVKHVNQQWARTATATIRDIKGPYNDGSYEYLVTAGVDFSRPLGPDNPETHETWWSSLAVRPIEEA